MDQISKLIQRQMKQQLLIVGCMLVALMGFAQTSETKVEDNLIFDGNELHKSETYAQAEKKYRKALARAPKNTIAQHNLGNTLFDESYYGEAFNAYKSATMSAQSKEEKHSALHNMGNVFMNRKDYAKAVETYKEALHGGVGQHPRRRRRLPAALPPHDRAEAYGGPGRLRPRPRPHGAQRHACCPTP